jgi:hypothetical protein
MRREGSPYYARVHEEVGPSSPPFYPPPHAFSSTANAEKSRMPRMPTATVGIRVECHRSYGRRVCRDQIDGGSQNVAQPGCHQLNFAEPQIAASSRFFDGSYYTLESKSLPNTRINRRFSPNNRKNRPRGRDFNLTLARRSYKGAAILGRKAV